MFKLFKTRGCTDAYKMKPGLEVIKLEYSLKLKIKCNDWLLQTLAHKQPIAGFILGMNLRYITSRPVIALLVTQRYKRRK